jgi:hypothetical protein
VDDDAKSVPETLETIQGRLRALESNQTSVSGQLEQINTAVSKLSVSDQRSDFSLSFSSSFLLLLIDTFPRPGWTQ